MPDTKLRRIAKTALTDEIAERKGHVETAPSKLLQTTFFWTPIFSLKNSNKYKK